MCTLYPLLTMFILVHLSQEIKVTERWQYLKTPVMRCTIAIADRFGPEWLKNPSGIGGTIMKWTGKTNCSFILSELKEAGNPNSTGHYDGYVGAIQRDEFDSAIFVVRADTLPFEPGKLTPPIYSADVAILSITKGKEVSIERGVTSFLDLQLPVRIYVVFGLFFTVPLILVYDRRHHQNIRHPVTFLKCYMHNCNTMLNLFLDQEQFSPHHLFAHVLTFTSSLFMLFAVFGILLSTVGSNMVVKREPQPIDTLDDLLASNRTALVAGTLFAGRVIESAPERTKLHQLKKRVDSITINADDSAQINQFLSVGIQNFIDRLANHSAVYLMAEEWARTCMRISCFVKGRFQGLEKLHQSSESFASGIMTFLMSNKVHPYTEKIISYIFTTMLETGNWLALSETSKPLIPDMIGYPGMKYDTSTLKCIDKHKEIQEQKFTPFSIGHMDRVFALWAILSAIACLTLALELVAHNFNKTSNVQVKEVILHPKRSTWYQNSMASLSSSST